MDSACTCTCRVLSVSVLIIIFIVLNAIAKLLLSHGRATAIANVDTNMDVHTYDCS